jgi:catechol 2,3-dioxygenase-like lactoylglutathione lyase family enzyme
VSISRVQLFSVPVSDPERARNFYVDVLGLELVREMQMAPDQRWVQVRPRGAETSMTLVTWFPSMPAGSLTGLVLETDDLDAEVRRLAELGVVFDDEVSEQPWGRSIVLADPDGNRLILQTTTP